MVKWRRTGSHTALGFPKALRCGLKKFPNSVTFEQSAFLQRLCQQLDYQEHGALTKREREVLALMLRGCSQEVIAKLLSIAPTTVSKHRQHIYEQLGVHNEHDVLLAAYRLGFFSLVEGSIP